MLLYPVCCQALTFLPSGCLSGFVFALHAWCPRLASPPLQSSAYHLTSGSLLQHLPLSASTHQTTTRSIFLEHHLACYHPGSLFNPIRIAYDPLAHPFISWLSVLMIFSLISYSFSVPHCLSKPCLSLA